jgi:FkbH-like protein
MVRAVLVPRSLPEYPDLVETLRGLFLAGAPETGRHSKTEQYDRMRKSRVLEAASETREDYLASLKLKLEIGRNRAGAVPRLSELTSKSNQFNLTTRRYSESELLLCMRDPGSCVYSLAVSDIFGDAGITGTVIVRYEEQTMIVDAFLLSCRVLGRGLEYAPWPTLIRDAMHRGATACAAQFLPTARNAQVAGFYDQLGMELAREENGSRFYHGELASLSVPPTPWIEVIDAA